MAEFTLKDQSKRKAESPSLKERLIQLLLGEGKDEVPLDVKNIKLGAGTVAGGPVQALAGAALLYGSEELLPLLLLQIARSPMSKGKLGERTESAILGMMADWVLSANQLSDAAKTLFEEKEVLPAVSPPKVAQPRPFDPTLPERPTATVTLPTFPRLSLSDEIKQALTKPFTTPSSEDLPQLLPTSPAQLALSKSVKELIHSPFMEKPVTPKVMADAKRGIAHCIRGYRQVVQDNDAHKVSYNGIDCTEVLVAILDRAAERTQAATTEQMVFRELHFVTDFLNERIKLAKGDRSPDAQERFNTCSHFLIRIMEAATPLIPELEQVKGKVEMLVAKFRGSPTDVQ